MPKTQLAIQTFSLLHYRSDAASELIYDFDTNIRLNYGALDCEGLPTNPATEIILDILRAVGQAAADIIVPAEKDIEAVDDLIVFIDDWLSSQPPTILPSSPNRPGIRSIPCHNNCTR